MDQKSGALKLINEVSSWGGSPCHMSVNFAAGYLAVANYFSGNATIIPINKTTGALRPASQVLTHSGPPGTPSLLHCAFIYKKYLTVVDKGLDMIYQYLLSPSGVASVVPAVVIQAPTGSGPTHIKFSPDGLFAVVVNALSVSVTILPVADPDSGLLFVRNIILSLLIFER